MIALDTIDQSQLTLVYLNDQGNRYTPKHDPHFRLKLLRLTDEVRRARYISRILKLLEHFYFLHFTFLIRASNVVKTWCLILQVVLVLLRWGISIEGWQGHLEHKMNNGCWINSPSVSWRCLAKPKIMTKGQPDAHKKKEKPCYGNALLHIVCTRYERVPKTGKFFGFLHLIPSQFSNRTATSVDDGARKSNNWIDQWQRDKLDTGSQV